MHTRWLVICMMLAGCNATAPTPPLKIDPPTGVASTEADPNAEAPDDTLRELAMTGINAGVLLGPLILAYSGVTAAYYDSRTKYLKTSNYGLLDISGWTFANGWYSQNLDDDASQLRAQFTDSNGTPTNWDVTLASNYQFHDNFPTALAQVRFEVDKALPSSSRMAISLFTQLAADATTPLDAYGSGSITAPAPLGNASFEALNATFVPGQDVTQGQIGLKSLAGAATLQFTGSYVKTGLSGIAKIEKNGHPAGNIVFDAPSAHWQIINAAGTYPLN